MRCLEKIFKVRLRFMFHYCSTTIAVPNEDRCKTANLPAIFDRRKAQLAGAINGS